MKLLKEANHHQERLEKLEAEQVLDEDSRANYESSSGRESETNTAVYCNQFERGAKKVNDRDQKTPTVSTK